MADTIIELTGTAGVSTVTPQFDFPSGTVKVEVEGVYIKDLTSGAEDSISLAVGETIEYICSDWDSITRIDIRNDKVSSDISVWVLPTDLLALYIATTSVFGDISGLVIPNNLSALNMASTLVSGDISGLILPNSVVTFFMHFTSIDYDNSTGLFEDVTDNLTKIDFDDCSLTEGQVDNVLLDLVTSGITNSSSAKTLDIAGTDGTNNAAPSLIGWSNKLTLEARGWTVSVNTTTYLITPMIHHHKQAGCM